MIFYPFLVVGCHLPRRCPEDRRGIASGGQHPRCLERGLRKVSCCSCAIGCAHRSSSFKSSGCLVYSFLLSYGVKAVVSSTNSIICIKVNTNFSMYCKDSLLFQPPSLHKPRKPKLTAQRKSLLLRKLLIICCTQ